MAKGFNLTAQINLRGPANLKPVIAQIRKELGTVSADVKLNIDARSIKSVDAITSKLRAMNSVLVQSKQNVDSLNSSFRTLSSALSTSQSDTNKATSSINKTAESAASAAKTVHQAGTAMEEFGKQSFLAIKRFTAFSFVTTGIFALTNAITGGFRAFINFDKELVKLQQVTGKGASGIAALEKEITRLATTMGVSSESLINVASTLAQAGLSADETRTALEALAKTELAPSFDNLTDTTEGAIAAMRQFGLEAGQLESALGSINAVAAAYAVESKDIISAIQRTGGVFATASKGVSQGTDALNEFVAIFTSVRQTTRESAETIATGLRTIFTRIQRASTIQQLKEFGIVLTDLEGKFVGPFEAIKRLSEGLSRLDPRDLRFSQIVEELGGFRQISKVIPLIQQFAVAQEALKVAQKGQGSLTEAQVVAQQSLANQLAKVREQFLALIRDVGKSTVFQGLFKVVTGLASGLISLAGAFKPILPILAVMGAIKGVSAITQFATGFFGGMGKGGGARSVGQNAGETISGAKEKEKAEATNRASQAITENTGAIRTLTTAINSLTTRVDANTSAINSRGASTLSGGGKVLGFNKGGIVPGSGKGDKIPALLEPGEVVINNTAANKYGRGNLVRMNKYYSGGNITNQTEVGGVPATTKVIKGKNKEIVGFDKDTYRINVDKKTLPIIYNKKDKNFRANRKVIPQESINKLIKNDPTSFEIWEDIVAQSFGASRANTNDPNYPVDIVKGNKLYDAKFRPDPQFKERDAVVKALSYRLENTNSGYKYNQSNKTIRLSKFLGTNITSGSDNFTDKGSISFVYPEFKDFPVDLEEIQTQLNIRKAQYQKFGEQGAGYFAKKAIEAIDNKKYISGNKDIINLISIPKKKKHTGGLIQKFAKGSKVGLGSLSTNDQGVAIRRVGVLDSDIIGESQNADKVKLGIKSLGSKDIPEYTRQLASLALQSKNLKRFRVIAGSPGAGKTSFALGEGANDSASLRRTVRSTILTPEDINNVDEVVAITSNVTDKKLDAYLRQAKRVYALSSDTPEEQALISSNKREREITGKGAYEGNKNAMSASVDFASDTARLLEENKKGTIVVGRKRDAQGNLTRSLRMKREDELPEIIAGKGKVVAQGFFQGTRGHAALFQAAYQHLLDKNPNARTEDVIMQVAGDMPVVAGREGLDHAMRGLIFPSDFRFLMAGINFRGATVLKGKGKSLTSSGNIELPSGSSGRRRFLSLKGADAFMSDKDQAVQDNYARVGINPINIPRVDDISGTMVRDLLFDQKYDELAKFVDPEILSILVGNQSQLKNRSIVGPLLIEQAQQAAQVRAGIINEQIAEILRTAPGGPYGNVSKKLKENHPDIANKIKKMRLNRDKIQEDAVGINSYNVMRMLASEYPEKYGLDISRRVQIPSPSYVTPDDAKSHLGDKVSKSILGDIAPQTLPPIMTAIKSTIPKKTETSLPAAAKVLQALGIPNIKTSKKNSDAEIYIRGSRKDAKLNPEELKRYQEIKSRYLSLVGAREEAEKEDIKKTKAKGLLFGAAGMYGSPFPPIKKQISSPELSGPVDVRITSGVMNAGTAKQIEQDFIRSEKKVVNRASKKLMIDNILTDAGLNKTINLDFDRTLAFGADKIATGSGSAKFAGFADRSIVQQTLGRARMSRLGMSLAQLVQTNPDLLQNLRVVTARPQNTLDLVQSWLSSKGLPIPLSQFTGVGGPSIREEDIPSLKAALLAPGSVFVDDDRKNIREARRYSQQNRAKIKTYRYGLDSVKQDANAEGTIRGIQFERIIESLGGPKADRSSKGIDFPKGLRAAAKYFGISSNIPTDAKRTLSGPSTVEDNIISYLKDNGYAALDENKVQAFMAGGKADARPFGTGSFKFPRRISNSYFKDFDEREARSKADEVWGGALDKRVPIDIDKVSEEFDKKPLDRTRFLSSFNRKIQTNELYQNLAQFAKFIGLPKEDLSVAIPQNVDFTPKLGQAISSAIGQFDRTGMGGRGMEKNTELAMEAAGFSAGQEQDLYGYNKLLEDKKKELIKITKTPVRTFDDGSFSYDQDAFRKVSAEIDAIRNNISELGKQKSNAQTKAADMIQKQAAQTGRGTVSLATKHFSSNGAQGSVFYHELTHQLFQGLRTKSAESFQKYKERVNQLFSTDNDQLADAFDSLNSGYNSADVVYGYRYKTNTLSQIISNNNKEKIKTPAVDSALDMWARSSNIKKARDFRPLNEPFNKILLNNSIKQSFIDRMEDSGKEEFLTTLVENAGKLDGMLQSVLDSTLDELLGSAGIARQKFASGGAIPARVSNGEAFVPPKLAKKIGYSKLDKLNKADRNGMSFSGGGISVFKGPGSGTSDSISTSLPVGGYVIREKATKALGLYKNGGSINVPKFADGGVLSKAEKKRRKDAFLTDQRGGVSREEARAVGAPRADFGGATVDVLADVKQSARERIVKAAETGTVLPVNMGEEQLVSTGSGTVSRQRGKTYTSEQAKKLVAKTSKGSTEVNTSSRKKDIEATANPKELDAIYKKIENTVLNNYKKLYAEEKKKIDDLYNQRRSEISDQIFSGTISASEGFDKIGELDNERRKSKQDVKAKLTAETKTAQVKAVEDFKQGKQTTSVNKRKTEQQDSFDVEIQTAMSTVAEEVKKKYQALLDQEVVSLKSFYNERVKQVKAEGGDVDAVVSEYRAALDQAKESFELGRKAETAEKQAEVPEQVAQSKRQQLDTLRSQKDPFYEAKKAADASAVVVPGMPRVNSGIAKENSAYFARRAEKAGMSVGGYKYSLAQQVGEQAYNIRQDSKFAKDEAKDIAIGKSRELKGLNVKPGEFKQLLSEGATSDEAKKAQAAVAEFATSLQKIAPSMDPKEIKAAAASLAEGLAAGDKSLEELIAGNEELSKVFAYTISEGEALDEAFKRVAESAGISAETIKANVSPQQIKQQEFIKSQAGQRFGGLASFAPGLTEKFSKTKLGGVLGKGADFVSGKGGALSKAFAGAGGFAGIGMGLATGAETLKQFLPKTMTSDPNTAGALGALSGAGTGAAAGAQLGSLAGPIGTLVGGVGGAIIGGIKGFFDAKNQAVLNKALENLASATSDLDTAFKKLETDFTSTNLSNVEQSFSKTLASQKDIDKMAMTRGIFGGINEEALQTSISNASTNQQYASRVAESKLKMTSSDDISKMISDIEKGVQGANPIVAAYTKGLEGPDKAQMEQKAYLDAFRDSMKRSGASVEQIDKEIRQDPQKAIQAGKKISEASAVALLKQEALAKSIKEVAVQSESLLDVYRRVAANTQRFSDEVGDMLSGAQASISSLGGKAEVPKVDRRGSERVLGNISAYSSDEVKVATQDVVSKLGGGEEAQKLGKQAEAAKFLQDSLPAMLRQENADPNKIIGSITSSLQNMDLDRNAINTMVGEIQKEIDKNQNGDLGTLANDIEKSGIGSISAASQEALKTLQNLSKTYNDTLQQSIDLQNQYNEVIMQSEEYMRKAGTIRISAELDLAKALGNSPTLAQLNEPFNFEVRDLTKGLIPGGTTDPAQIAAGIVSATKENEILKDKNTQLNSTPTGADGQAAANALKEQQKNNAAMSANSKAINQGRQALEKLANDGTKAANALAKIEENERIYEGGRSLGRTVLTSDSQQLYEMNKSLAAYTKTISGRANAKDANSLQFRKDAFAGFDIVKNLMPQSMSKQIEARLQKEMIEAMPEGQQMLDQQVGIGNDDEKITLRDVLDRAISGKANEEDPNVKAYREAVDTQIKANEQLSMLNELQALKIQESMIGLQEFLANKFPEILTKAVTASREDAATKPEVSSGDAKTESGKKRQQTEQEIVSKQEEKTKLDKEIANIDTQLEKEKKKKWIDQDPAKIAKLENQKRSVENKRKDVEFGIKNRQARLEEEKAAEKQELAQVKQEEETKKKEKEATKPVVVSAERVAKQQEIADKEKQIQENKDKQASEAQASTQTQTSTYTVSRPATSTAAASASQQVYGSTRTAAAKGKPEARTEPTVKELENKLKGLRSQGKKGRDSSEYSQTVFMLDRKKNEEKVIKDKVKIDAKKQRREAYLSRFRPEVREKMMTKKEKAERDAQVAQAEEAKRQAEVQAQEQQATSSSMQSIAQQEQHHNSDPIANLTPEQKESLNRAGAIAQEHNAKMEDLARREQAGETLTQQEKNALSQHREGQRMSRAVRSSTAGNSYTQGNVSSITSSQDPRDLPPQDPNNLRLPQPIPSNRPASMTPSTSNPTTASASGASVPAQLLTLDPASLEGLNNFNKTFGEYVNSLMGFKMQPIEHKLNVTVEPIQVQVTGAAAFEALEERTRKLAETLIAGPISQRIDDLQNKIAKITGGGEGIRPTAASGKPRSSSGDSSK